MEPIQALKKEKKHLKRLAELSRRIYTPLAPLSAAVFRSREPIPPQRKESLDYRPIRPGETWGGLFDCAWFRFRGTVPPEARGRHVAAHIYIGGEGLIYRGDEPWWGVAPDTSYIDRVTAGLAKSVVEISPCAEGGEPFEAYMDAGYNGYYNYPVGRGKLKFCELCAVDDALLDYYYDYLTAASLMTAQKDAAKRAALEQKLDASYAALPDLPAARAALAPLFAGTPDGSVSFTAIGHSHLDLAWLWPIRETRRKAARTFSNQINNLARYPDYLYGASQPQQFQFIRELYPQQYAKLQALAREGRLEPQGAMWVEADTNLTSGESLVRQLHYGSEFFRTQFGREMKICWLPDVFGYNGNLPQILKKSGVPYFLTIKLSWNEHNPFPHRSFVWRGIDGSEVLVHMPPADTYNSAGSPACAAFARDNYPEREIAPEALMVYGNGDGGGGPGEAHIEMLRRQRSLEGSPRVAFGTAESFFGLLERHRDALPRYGGELYLEKHQGTYTTQARNKLNNRRCEYALQDLEALCALRLPAPFPAEKLDAWWKEVLFYQFHDIIPGSAIRRVYEETGARYAAIRREIAEETARTLAGIGRGEGRSVFNPTPFPREGFLSENGVCMKYASPAWGFGRLQKAEPAGLRATADTLENERLRVVFANGGEVVSLVTKADGREYAGDGLNRLTLYRDKFSHYNAWDIDWKYMERPHAVLREVSHVSFVRGGEAVRRSVYRHGRTRIVQEAFLTPGGATLSFRTTCEWHETFRMLRADFLTGIDADQVRCDIQFGSILRSARDVTPQEKAQFEICAHKYVDLSDGGRGLSLLNDCKYGHRAKDGLLSLNLLRSPVFPDPKADRGHQAFTYALYPHAGDCGADTLREAYFLNKPPVAFDGQAEKACIAAADDPAVVIDSIKPAYDGNGAVLRLYESQGRETTCALSTALPHGEALRCDLTEAGGIPCDLSRLHFDPFELVTLRLR